MYASVQMPPDQIQQRKQENPNDVDEMPVQAADLDGAGILPRDGSVPCPEQHPRHDSEPDDHVNGVQAGHREIQREEDLRVPEVLGLELERRPGNVMLVELLVVLHPLDAEEDHTEGHCRQQENDQELSL